MPNRHFICTALISRVHRLRELIRGGFVFYGGLAGGIAGVLFSRKIHRLPVSDLLSVSVPLLPLGHAFGRIGCALAGCCYGIAYSGLGSVTYTHSVTAPNGVALFPVQISEALCLFLLAALLLRLFFRRKPVGILVIVYLACYSAMRFLLEFLRGDAARGFWCGLSVSQWISCAILFSILPGLFLIPLFRRKSSQK